MIESQLDSNQDEELIKITTVIKKLQVIPTMKVMLHKIINNALYAGKVAHDYQIQKKGITPGSKVLISDICIYCEYRFSDDYIPKFAKNTTTHTTTYQWILWDSPIAQSVWKQCKLVLQDINIQMQANSYQEAILLLERLSIVTDDQTAKLKAVITQNLIVYALWVLYCGDKRINELKGKEELTDSKIDNWIEYIVSNFSILVTQEVKLLLYHRRELALTSKKMKSDSKK